MVKALKDIQVKCGFIGPRNRLFLRMQEMLAVSGIPLQDEMSFEAFSRQTPKAAATYDFLSVDINEQEVIGSCFLASDTQGSSYL